MQGQTIVDLHIHSYCSDGTMSPEEILNEAKKNHAEIIAITDHDVLEGSISLVELCAHEDILCIPGVEIDSLFDGLNVHILGYGIDLFDENFMTFVKHCRYCLDEGSVRLIGKMETSIPSVSLKDYTDFQYDRKLGGWKALHYFYAKGLTGFIKEGIKLYPEYGILHTDFNYPSVDEVCREIKKAGGVPILAHPGEVIDPSNHQLFIRKLEKLINLGIEGIECFYPTHSLDITEACLNVCRRNHLLITSGSDCHGSFGKAKIGQMQITLDKLNLGSLISV
ncbi:MAG: PHP domain-containing protein [Ruminiclostridium sp.]|nr:PHP domain-containing protein [Ruminiclostridium sp.]